MDGPWGDAAAAAAGGKLQFLTHAHKDHTAGIEAGAAHLVCSAPTLRLLRIKHPGLGRRLDGAAVYAGALYPLLWWHLHLPRQRPQHLLQPKPRLCSCPTRPTPAG